MRCFFSRQKANLERLHAAWHLLSGTLRETSWPVKWNRGETFACIVLGADIRECAAATYSIWKQGTSS
jgi:hypothetical protein